MRLVGFSTGALAYADFRRGLQMLHESRANAVELSALRTAELDPLMGALATLDLGQFEFISVHAPSGVDAQHERNVVEKLQAVIERAWPIVVHPDSIHDHSLWRPFGKLMCIENMDKRKPIARTRDELGQWFDRFPEASLCLDLAHVRQIDPTMTEAYLMLRDFKDRLAEVHLSEINSACKHESISYGATLAYQQVASLIPEDVPVILESIVSAVLVDDEIEAAHEALATGGPRPRVRNRRSGATPRPVHA
jgi:hypothetical protein